MPIYKVEGPDGRIYSVEGPPGASPDEVVAFVQANYKQLKPKEGLGAAASKGLESLISSGRTALGALTGSAEEAAQAGLERGEKISQKYADQVSLDKVKKAYEERGLLPAAGEAISQIPAALAEQAPNLAATFGTARAGAALGSLAGPVGTVVGGLAGAAVPSLFQQFGGNVERQAAEQKARGEALKIDTGAAGAAALPQAALDVAGTLIPLGGRLVSKLTGIPEKALLGKSAAEVTKLADEKLLATLAKGTATGALAEIPTEITQQMLERAQAGLSLTDADALKEYGETAYQVGLLAPIGAAGRLSERAGARGEVMVRKQEEARVQREEEAKKAKEEADKLEAYKQTDTYLDEIQQKYTDYQKQFDELNTKAKVKTDANDFAGIEAKREARKQLAEFKQSEDFKSVVTDYTAALPRLKAREQQRAKAEADAKVSPYDYMLDQTDTVPAPKKFQQKTQAEIDAELADVGYYDQQVLTPKERAAALAAATQTKPPSAQELLKYANERMRLAESQTAGNKQADNQEYIEYLLQDPYRARLIVDQNLPLPGLKRNEQDTIRRALGKELDKQTKAEFAARTEDLKTQGQKPPVAPAGAPGVTSYLEDLDTLDLQRREGFTDKEVADMANIPRNQPFQDQGELFGSPNLRSGIQRGTLPSGDKSRARIAAELQIAQASRNKPEIARLKEILADMDAKRERQQQMEALDRAYASGNQDEIKRLTAELGVEGQPRRIARTGQLDQVDLDRMRAEGVPEDEINQMLDASKQSMETTLGGTRMPEKVAQRQAVADAREEAYADVVRIVSRYNKGRAKQEELDAARQAVLDSLVKEVEFERGQKLTDQERTAIEREANIELRDLITRFGDTRDMYDKGTKKQPQLTPAQEASGEFTDEAGAPYGFPTVESRTQGRRTFGNPYAAAMAIQEGLDQIRDRYISPEGPGVTRTYAPETTSPEALLKQLDGTLANDKSSPEVRKLAARIGDNWREVQANAAVGEETALPPSRRGTLPTTLADDIAQWLYSVNIGQESKEYRDRVEERLDAIERAKLSETDVQTRETAWGTAAKPVTAIQEDLFSDKDYSGYKFANYAEFDKFLGSDALQQMRSAIGLGRPTLTRLLDRVRVFANKAAALRKQSDAMVEKYDKIRADKEAQLEQLQTMNAGDLAQQKRELEAAQKMLKEAQESQRQLVNRLDSELFGLQAQYIQAATALEFSIKTSEDITKAIAANVNNFTGKEEAALQEVLAAKEQLASAIKHAYSPVHKGEPERLEKQIAEIKEGISFDEAFRGIKETKQVLAAQQAVIDATTKWRRLYALNQSQSRIVKFLDQDLNLQMQLQAEIAKFDGLSKDMLDAGLELTMAKKKQDQSIQNRTELKKVRQEVSTAQKLVEESEKRIADQEAEVEKIKGELGVTEYKINHRFSEDSTNGRTIRAANTIEQDLVRALGPVADAARNIERTAQNAINRFLAGRREGFPVTPETQLDRENRDAEVKRIENERNSRLASLEGERISFEKRRKLAERLNATPEAYAELDAVIDQANTELEQLVKDEQLIKDQIDSAKEKQARATANKIKAEREAEMDVYSRSIKDYEALLADVTTMRDQLEKEKADAEKAKERLGETEDTVNQIFSNEVEYDLAGNPIQSVAAAMSDATQKRLAKVEENIKTRTESSQEKGISPELRTSRIKELNKAKREKQRLLDRLSAKTGITRKNIQLGTETETVIPGTRLDARKIGPVVKKTVTAGNVRTGDVTTAEERKLSTQNKITQAGQTRPVTSKQAQRQANKDTELQRITDRLNYLEDLDRRNDAALETATAAGDTARVNKLTGNQARIAAEIEAKRDELASLGNITKIQPSTKKLLQLAAISSQGPALKDEVDTEKSAAAIMQNISTSTNDEINRAIAERLKMLLGNTEVRLVDDLRGDNGEAVYGTAASNGSFIELDKTYGLNEQTALHEGVHAGVERVLNLPEDQLTPEQLAAKKELVAIYNALKADKSMPYPELVTSLNEFAAEALTSPKLRTYMQSKPWTLKYMWDAFKSVILRLLGVKTPTNMSEAAIAAVDRLMTKVPRPTEADMTLDQPRLNRARNSEFDDIVDISNKMVARQKTWSESIKVNATGLAFETQLVDRFAGFERLSKVMDKLKGIQMMYYLRMYDQRMNFVAQSAANGALQIVEKVRADGQKEYLIESRPGASLRGVSEILKGASDVMGGADNASRAFTSYMAALRAKRVGLDKLNFSGTITQAELDRVLATVEGNKTIKDVFERARQEYNEYNRGLVNFAVSAGAIRKADAEALLKSNDYIPFYRERNGVVELMIGGENPIRIGNIKEQPYLQELVGGDAPIMDFMVSSVQNTNMMVDMALRNLATKNAVFELKNMDMAKITDKAISGPDVIKFKVDGEDRFAQVDTDRAGVPADILVKGMEGIPTQMPFALRVLAAPASFLRKAVTATPVYAARQLFRDSLAAPLLSGADFIPVTGALRQIGSATKGTLESRGITGGQVFTGGAADITDIMRRIASGKSGWSDFVSKAESISMEADALSRRAQYNSYIKQGLSEMEATYMALESMNFTKRGASPSIHMANSLIPFFNAQIQGLNVLYKSLFGKMPFNERLKVQEKLLTRGLMIAAGTLAYAAMMQDDEAYQNATPEQKYGNWFVRIPGVEEAVRLPIPFEIGYIFKALPEALYNTMVNERGGEQAVQAFRQILLNTIPGGSSFGIPQAMRPAIEAGLGKSFYTGRDIMSPHEQKLLPEAQFRENTSQIAKSIGAAAGVSPIILEQLVQGYTGSLGLAFLQAISMPFGKSDSPEKAFKRLSEMPVVGTVFQPNDAGGIINMAYDRMNEFSKVKSTVDDLIERGEKAKALELINTKANEYAAGEIAHDFTSTMGELTQYERAIRASNLTPEQKRERLDEIRKIKIRYADTMRGAVDRTVPQ
jgi:hypothetical protein